MQKKLPMKGLFSRDVPLKSTHPLSKLDKKKLAAQVNGGLDIKQEYTMSILSNKVQVIKKGPAVIYFKHHGKLFPAVTNFDMAVWKTVTLDDGAVKPLESGADVMAPGILLFEETCPDFEKDDVLGVEIVGRGVFAVGIALMSSREMKRTRRGPVVQVLHVAGDYLNRNG